MLDGGSELLACGRGGMRFLNIMLTSKTQRFDGGHVVQKLTFSLSACELAARLSSIHAATSLHLVSATNLSVLFLIIVQADTFMLSQDACRSSSSPHHCDSLSTTHPFHPPFPRSVFRIPKPSCTNMSRPTINPFSLYYMMCECLA